MTTTHLSERAIRERAEKEGMHDYSSRTLQIIPADGWLAAYEDGDSGEVSKLPLACWALTQTSYLPDPSDITDRVFLSSVEGMLPGAGFAKDRPGFLGYTRNVDATAVDQL